MPPDDCSGPVFCVRHRFETWIGAGTTWTSPTVRIQVGLTAAQSMLAYRRDNGIDAYPSATWTSADTSVATRGKEYVRETFAYLYYRIFGGG